MYRTRVMVPHPDVSSGSAMGSFSHDGFTLRYVPRMFWYMLLGTVLYITGFLFSGFHPIVVAIGITTMLLEIWTLRGLSRLGVWGSGDLTINVPESGFGFSLPSGWYEVWYAMLALPLSSLSWLVGPFVPLTEISSLLFAVSMIVFGIYMWDALRLTPSLHNHCSSRFR